ncbi:uncharacterized protein [Onthophagus taurus]|uniref:uncharacterized protein n=1 Tax=Onthophagus taurus TaxID=166361 RepID=UPI0039BDEC5F
MSQINELLKSKRLEQMKRVFSTESTTSSCQYTNYGKQENLNQVPYKYNRFELVLKLLELGTDIINIGLYSSYLSTTFDKHNINSQNVNNQTEIWDPKIERDYVTIKIFPNVVFGSFIIIVGVILISYLLGQVISEVIGRIFNTLALVLHFISGCITLNDWIFTVKTAKNASACNTLLAQVITTFLCTFMYSFDLFLSLKRALKYDDVDG